MGFNTSSVWIKIALICLAVGTLLFVIGFATNSWMTFPTLRGEARFGLWSRYSCGQRDRRGYYYCDSEKITSQFLTNSNWTDWYRATQVFECFGLIGVILALIIMLIFIFVDSLRKRSALIAVILLSFGAAVAMAIGFCIFGFKFDDYYITADVGWSMGLAIAGAILTFVAGVMAVIDLKNHEVRIITVR